METTSLQHSQKWHAPPINVFNLHGFNIIGENVDAIHQQFRPKYTTSHTHPNKHEKRKWIPMHVLITESKSYFVYCCFLSFFFEQTKFLNLNLLFLRSNLFRFFACPCSPHRALLKSSPQHLETISKATKVTKSTMKANRHSC